MDIFRLENLLNALKLGKKVEPTSRGQKGRETEKVRGTQSQESDSVTISDEAVLKSKVEELSAEVRQEGNAQKTEKIRELKERIAHNRYSVSSSDVADRITRGPDVYEQLK
ncbi:MAG: hypothetical protein GF333_05180 [Candidatus Omnitrophica bacterium]|nr:hypothetical protein [Candidatus Omnitrophota bacterium]